MCTNSFEQQSANAPDSQHTKSDSVLHQSTVKDVNRTTDRPQTLSAWNPELTKQGPEELHNRSKRGRLWPTRPYVAMPVPSRVTAKVAHVNGAELREKPQGKF